MSACEKRLLSANAREGFFRNVAGESRAHMPHVMKQVIISSLSVFCVPRVVCDDRGLTYIIIAV